MLLNVADKISFLSPATQLLTPVGVYTQLPARDISNVVLVQRENTLRPSHRRSSTPPQLAPNSMQAACASVRTEYVVEDTRKQCLLLALSQTRLSVSAFASRFGMTINRWQHDYKHTEHFLKTPNHPPVYRGVKQCQYTSYFSK